MSQDYREFLHWIDDESKVPVRIEKIDNVISTLDLRSVRNTGHSRYRAILSLLALKLSKDWFSGNILGNYSLDKINDHHIFPVKSEIMQKLDSEFVNSILNKTLLSEETNKKIKNRNPKDYYQDILKIIGNEKKVEEIMATHLISPLAIKCMQENDFDGFIKERERTIIDELKKVTGLISDETHQQSIKELIAFGESDGLEFKSTLCWDIKEGAVNKKIEEAILKTVAAFANSHGGTLLIGVDDNGSVLGLENDYHSLGDVDRDRFELHLRNLLNHQFGTGVVTSKTKIGFHRVDEKEVCQIDVTPANEPLIMKVKDKNGQVTEKFYVRSGNSSQEIPLSELTAYMKDRF
jgi:predicted HTH transcriptional regulator